MNLKKYLSCCIQSWSVTIIMWFLWGFLACLQIWCSLSDFKIYEFRPSNDIFFVSLIALSGIIFIYEKLKSWSIEYLNNSKNDEKDRKINDLNKIIRDNYSVFLREHLSDIFDDLQYTMAERVCIYAISDCKKHFECIARYSVNPIFNEYGIRKEYPLNAGIIGKVWVHGKANGWIRDKDIPIKGTNKKSKKQYYDYFMKNYNTPQTIAEKLRMNPVDIIAEVIRDRKNEPIAVIIFESTQKNKICEEKIQMIYTNHKKNRIINAIETIKKPSDIEDGAMKENM